MNKEEATPGTWDAAPTIHSFGTPRRYLQTFENTGGSAHKYVEIFDITHIINCGA